MAIYGITHCYGNLVTMATEACVCNFTVWRYMKSLFGTHIPWGNSYPSYDCCYRNLVTKATEACIYNMAVWRYMKSFLVHRSLEATAIHCITCCYHGNRGTCLYLCCLKVNELHIWFTYPLRQQQSIIWFVAMETLLPWQQRQMLTSLLFESKWISYLVQRSFQTTAIHHMICCTGNLVTMATKTYAYIFAVWR